MQSSIHGSGFKYKVIHSKEPVSENLRTSVDGVINKDIVFAAVCLSLAKKIHLRTVTNSGLLDLQPNTR